MDRKEFIKRLLIGGAGMSLLPSVLMGRNGKAERLRKVNLMPVQDHVRHGLFSPLDQARLEGGPEWLTHYRLDRFHSNGIHAAGSDLLHLTLGLGGKSLGITFKDGKAFVGQENGASDEIRLAKSGKTRLFKSRYYEAWVLSGKGDISFPESKAAELFLSAVEGTSWVQGYKSSGQEAVWGRQLQSPEFRLASQTRSLVLLKFA